MITPTDVCILCSSTNQTCRPPFSFPLQSGTSSVQIQFTVGSAFPTCKAQCSSFKLDIFFDGIGPIATTPFLGWPGGPPDLALTTGIIQVPIPAPDGIPHALDFFAVGKEGGCNTGRIESWTGALTVFENEVGDNIPPETTPTVTPAPVPDSGDWHAGPAQVSLAAVDLPPPPGGSGVKHITHKIGTVETVTPGDQVSFTVEAEGVTTVGFCAEDNANNIETLKTLVVKIDRTPPVTGATTAPAASGGGKDIEVALRATDVEGSGVKEICYALAGAQAAGEVCVPGEQAVFTISAEGTTTLTFFAVDKVGNREAAQAIEVRVDKSAPVTTATVVPAANDDGWHSDDEVEVTLRASDPDGSGVKNITYCLQGAQAGDCVVAPGPETSFVISNEGITTVTYFATDNADNVEGLKTLAIRLDRTVPVSNGTVAPSANPAGWRQSAVVTLSATDALSGVKEIRYTLSGAETAQATVAGTEVSFPITEEGTTTVTFFAVDVADNQETSKSLEVKIDRTAPVTSFGTATSETSGVEVTLRASDTGGSGVKEIHYTLLGAGEQPEQVVPGGEVIFTISSEGSTAVSFFAVDDADNREATQQQQVVVAPQAPVTEAELDPPPNPAGWNKGNVVVTLRATDGGGSGVKEIHFRLSTAPSEIVVPEPLAVFTVAAEGTTVVTYFAVDNSGVQEGPKTLEIKIDKVAPDSAGTVAPAPNAAGWLREDAVVTVQSDDALSGVVEIRYELLGAQVERGVLPGSEGSFTIWSEGETTARFAAIDEADNLETEKSLAVKIDKTAPVITFIGNAGVYTLDQEVDIRVEVADPLSGVASSNARDVKGPAFSFPLGPNVITVTATDVAGNTVTESTTFTVRFTFDGLRALIRRFVTNPALQMALLRLVDLLEAFSRRRNFPLRRAQIAALIALITRERGTGIDRERADLLMRVLGSS